MAASDRERSEQKIAAWIKKAENEEILKKEKEKAEKEEILRKKAIRMQLSSDSFSLISSLQPRRCRT